MRESFQSMKTCSALSTPTLEEPKVAQCVIVAYPCSRVTT